MSSNLTGDMDNLKKWLSGMPLHDISSYEVLKQEVYEHAKRDYLFFSYLIGYVQRYLKEEIVNDAVRNCLYQLLFDLLSEGKIRVAFVSESSLEYADSYGISAIHQTIEEVKVKWESLGDKEPEVNEVIWITNSTETE
jgi:hypothetical protein